MLKELLKNVSRNFANLNSTFVKCVSVMTIVEGSFICSNSYANSAAPTIQSLAQLPVLQMLAIPTPNDPLFTPKSRLHRIHAPEFWELSTGSKNVKVLVCDTGIESHHPDLKNNISLTGFNFADGSTNTEPSGNSHGTRMAGIIGAEANNGIGGVGVAWNVTIIPGKISNDPKGGVSHKVSAQCIRWGADHGIRIVNLSYSGANNNPDVIEAAKYLHDRNGILVVSAGNELGKRNEFPDDPNIIAVGFTNSIDWVMSSTGPYVDLVAPGTSMQAPTIGGGYSVSQGASDAVAVVSGAAALMLSVRPELTATQLTDLILQSVEDKGAPGRDPSFGTGILDLQVAVKLLRGQ